MNRFIFFIFTIVFFLPGKVWSQVSVKAETFAEVIDALSANEDESLNFGRFSVGSNGGTIIISPDGLRTAQGTAVAAGGNYSPGRFMVTGAAGATFTIELPDEPAILVHDQSGKTMQIDGWLSDPPSGESSTLPDGSRLVSIGARLNVGTVDENPVGQYAGTFTITFAYN